MLYKTPFPQLLFILTKISPDMCLRFNKLNSLGHSEDGNRLLNNIGSLKNFSFHLESFFPLNINLQTK